MQKSYTKNYLKIYFWQGLSFILSFIALFIVVPFLSAQPIIYGLYSVCSGLVIFLSYSDFGFMDAGTKYAAEHHARGELGKEREVVGFTAFILGSFLLIFAAVFYFFSFHPDFLIKGLSENQAFTAAALLKILSFSAFIAFFQRIAQMIFSLRLEEYITYRINIIGSVIRILSVFFFFTSGSYRIVAYYAFSQSIMFLAALISFLIAINRYHYGLTDLGRACHFNRSVFRKVKPLAFSSLFVTISWVLYYELDLVFLGRISGAEKVAIFAIGLTAIAFFRNVFGVVFSPFAARFNHFVGENDSDGLKKFYGQIVRLSASLAVFPTVCLAVLANPFVLSWVGSPYQSSVPVVRWLVLCNVLAFISYPAGILLMALEKIKKIYWISLFVPVIYWLGIFLTYNYWGVLSLAVFKFTAFLLAGLFYSFFSAKFLEISLRKFLSLSLKPLLVPVLFILMTSFLVEPFLPDSKSPQNLFIVLLTAGVIIFLAFLLQLAVSPALWRQIKKLKLN